MSKKVRKKLEELNRVNDMLQRNQKNLSEQIDFIKPHLEKINNIEQHLSEISLANELKQSVITIDLEEHMQKMREFEANLPKLENLGATEAIKQLSDASIVMKENERLLASSLTDMSSLEGIEKLAEEAKIAYENLSLSSFLPEQNEILDVIKSVDIKSLGSEGLILPVESITGLKTLSNTVKLPYESESIGALNTLVGDWKGVISPPDEILKDFHARVDYYRNLGFDSRLTTLPEPIFTNTLHSTGILREDLFSPVFPYIKPEREYKEAGQEEEIVKHRMLEAYDILYSFENGMRGWLDEVMTDKFGPQWVKQRVPGNVLVEWRRKRKEALSNGEEEKHLLWYADFTDYIDIIVRKDNWKEVFVNVFHNSLEIQVSFNRLHPIRICTMHSRMLTKDDMLLLTVEVQRVLRAIGKISDEN